MRHRPRVRASAHIETMDPAPVVSRRQSLAGLRKSGEAPMVWLSLWLVAIGLLVASGCYRGQYRRQADAEAQCLIKQKLNDPRWDAIDPSIATHPESRMHDVNCPDCPPMPPDDPTSHRYMRCVDGKPGHPFWDENGHTPFVANPDWLGYLPRNEQQAVELDMERAVQLSLVHSSEFQQQKETLYLSALDVSLERFGFDSQAFAGWSSFFRSQGRLAPGGSQSSLNFDRASASNQIRKLGITGTNFVVGLANSIIWNFSGPNTQTASSLINFSLVQPLLRGAGQARILESLTQAERTLLANVRQLERFRRGFYLSIVTGRNAGAGPSRGGDFLSEPGGASSNAGGFLGLLQSQQDIRIQEFNVRALEDVIEQFRQFFAEEQIDLFQLRLAESSLYNSQQQLLQSKIQYQNQLDQFKRDLGLPPDLAVVIKDPFLDQFKLISDELLERQLELNRARDAIGTVFDRKETAEEGLDVDPANPVALSDEAYREALTELRNQLPAVKEAYEQISTTDFEEVKRDIEKLRSVREERVASLGKLRKYVEDSELDLRIERSLFRPSSVVSPEDLEAQMEELATNLREFHADLESLEAMIVGYLEQAEPLDTEGIRERINTEILLESPELLTRLANHLIALTLIQASARTDTVQLPEVDISSKTAISIARQLRRDLMNARASLVDRWRQIEFVANDLESTLDLVFEGSVGNVGDNPFRVRWETNQMGVGIRFDAPITRLAERNQYREALINYQQSRRRYYNFVDAIKQNLRQTIRNIEQNRVLFELNRLNIKISVQQVESRRLSLIEPPPPGSGARTLGATAARDLTDALNGLQRNQSTFLRNWVENEVLRRSLDFDLGTMQLTPDGYWLDPGKIDAENAMRAAEAYGVQLDQLECLDGQEDEFPWEEIDSVEPHEVDLEEEAPAIAPLPPVS